MGFRSETHLSLSASSHLHTFTGVHEFGSDRACPKLQATALDQERRCHIISAADAHVPCSTHQLNLRIPASPRTPAVLIYMPEYMTALIVDSPVAVVGGSGGVAQQCVKQLLAKDHQVVAVGRDAAKLQGLFGSSPLLKCISADVEQPDTLKAAFAGVSAVINASSGCV